jgi:nucleotide-binding universal stress UspA family protein
MSMTKTSLQPDGSTTIHPAGGQPTDVLALATSAAPWSPAVQVGVALASRWGSLLTGCSIAPSLASLNGAESEPSVMSLLLDTRPEDIENADAFREFARHRGVPHSSWVVARSGLARTLRQLGAWHDLAVLERDMVEEDALIELLGEALLTCRLPTLVLPPQWNRTPRFSRVLVGWDGSLEAVRAIHAALPLLLDADKVTLIDGGRRNAGEQGAYAPPFEPFLFLARHHVEADPVCVDLAPDEAGAGLLARCMGSRADLLVMGAFGHSRLRERVLGGATRYVLHHAQTPVFLVH